MLRLVVLSGRILVVFASAVTFAAAYAGVDNCGEGVPDELGQIMILEYHGIEKAETRWSRSSANFNSDLQVLCAAGYRPIGLGEYIDGRIDLPAGTRPVIFTFDDSSPGQFRYIEKNGRKQIDPECAVGIWSEFRRAHPEFRCRGVFYVLPEAAQPHKLFGQPGYEAEKLRELVDMGFEIGNHTLWHANLKQRGASQVQRQLALAVESIQRLLPGYDIRSVALPFGAYPVDSSLVERGAYRGIGYHNEAILEVAGGPVPSPYSRRRDLLHLTRIQVTDTALPRWLRYFDQPEHPPFVSDGSPEVVTVPRVRRDEVDPRVSRAFRVAVN